SSRDLDGSNPDHSNEVWVLDGAPEPLLSGVRSARADEPAVDGSGDLVAFTSTGDLDEDGGNEDGSSDVFVLDRSTSEVDQLTDLAVGEEDPDGVVISADGTTVAFTSTAAPGDESTAGTRLVHVVNESTTTLVVAPSNAPGAAHEEMPRGVHDVSGDGRWLLLEGTG
ncbi:hypothetical protein B7486_79135, partial [cyanobacterium TDX16]